MKQFNPSDELSKLLSQELAKSIDKEIMNELFRLFPKVTMSRRNKINKIYKKGD
jgi:hypothetical protein